MRPASPAVKLTYDDFVRFPDDGQRHELIEGEHVVTPSPNTRHQRIAGTLHALIWNYLEVHPIGEVFIAPFDVVMSEFNVVEPDVLYLSNERAAAALTEAHVRGVPELVVEVMSKSTRRRDETAKRALYERMGVTEYWVVDPRGDTVRVHRHDGQGFTRPVELSGTAGDILQTPLLPGIEIRLERVFRER
jgi:Uma2 family endonuclease